MVDEGKGGGARDRIPFGVERKEGNAPDIPPHKARGGER